MNELRPTESDSGAKPPIAMNNLESNSAGNSLTPGNKPSKKPFIIIGMILLLAALVVAIIFLTTDKSPYSNQLNNGRQPTAQEATGQKAVEQVFISPIDNSKTDIKKENYYALTIGESQYYGRVSKISNEYIRLLPTAYKKANTLTFTGKELHGPEAATYFRVAHVTKFQELTDATILDAVKAADSVNSDAFPSSDINKYVKSGQFQAYFFADGTAFFAKTTSLAGTFLADSRHVYLLQANGPAGPSQQMSLALAQPEQYNKRTVNGLLYWQNMKSDSQIAKAATAFEKNR